MKPERFGAYFGLPARRLIALLMVLGGALFPAALSAQSRVLDPEFDKLLQGLLTHQVPESAVEDLRGRAGVLFLDAREAREYEVSHIPDALWVGYDDFSLARLEGVAKDQPIVVYCSVGYRSERVAEKLLQAGFTQVSNLYGGIFEWANRGCALTDEQGPTRAVHAYNLEWGKWLQAGEKVY